MPKRKASSNTRAAISRRTRGSSISPMRRPTPRLSEPNADMTRRALFALPGSALLAGRLALTLDAEIGELAEREFPDGETYLRVETPVVGCDVALVSALRH